MRPEGNTPSGPNSPLERDSASSNPRNHKSNTNRPRLTKSWHQGSSTSLNSLNLNKDNEEDTEIEINIGAPHCENCDHVSFSSAEELARDDKEVSPTVNEWTPLFSDLLTARNRDADRRFSSTDIPSLSLDNTDYLDEDDYLTYSLLPNGMVILSPEARLLSATTNDTTAHNSGKSLLMRPHPKYWAHLKQTHSSNNSPDQPHPPRDFRLQAWDNRVKCAPINRSHTLECLNTGVAASEIGEKKNPKRVNLGKISKEELYTMWRVSEKELHRKLRTVTLEKEALEKELEELKQT